MRKMIYIIFCTMSLFFCQAVSFGQVFPKVKVISVEEIKPYAFEHVPRVVDKRINFQLFNTTDRSIIFYGSELGLKDKYLEPIRYLIRYNEELDEWIYPTSNNKPVSWKRTSPTYKKSRVLKSGEFINFSHDFSSEDDCDQRLKFTTNISFDKSKQVYEVRSEEFMVSKCKDKVVENCSL